MAKMTRKELEKTAQRQLDSLQEQAAGHIAKFKGVNGRIEHVVSWEAGPAIAAEVIVHELRDFHHAVKVEKTIGFEEALDELIEEQVKQLTELQCWRHNSTGYFDNAVREAQAEGRARLLQTARDVKRGIVHYSQETCDNCGEPKNSPGCSCGEEA